MLTLKIMNQSPNFQKVSKKSKKNKIISFYKHTTALYINSSIKIG